MISQTASVLPWMQACRPAAESWKSMKANSDRLKPSSTRRALASLGVHPCRFAMRLRRLPLSRDRRMLSTVERVAFIYTHLVCNCCKYCTPSESVLSRPNTSTLNRMWISPGAHGADQDHHREPGEIHMRLSVDVFGRLCTDSEGVQYLQQLHTR